MRPDAPDLFLTLKPFMENLKTYPHNGGESSSPHIVLPFVVFEGIDGSGKTTQAKLLAQKLQEYFSNATAEQPWAYKRKVWVIESSQTLSTPEFERSITIHSDKTSFLWHCLKRCFLKDGEFLREFKNNSFIIWDRFVDSTLVYQNVLSSQDEHFARKCVDFFVPKLTIFLDIPESLAWERNEAKPEKNDRLSLDSLITLQNRYRNLYSLPFTENRQLLWIKVDHHIIEGISDNIFEHVKQIFAL
jgi:dTMP kinase